MALLLLCLVPNQSQGAGVSNAPPFNCSPLNYAGVDDQSNTGMPYNFCPWTYLPWRVLIPEHPAHIDYPNSTVLQNVYAPDSVLGPNHLVQTSIMGTLGRRPTATNEGGGNRPMYRARNDAGRVDPLVTVDCDRAQYHCASMNSDVTSRTPEQGYPISVPAFRIPPYARFAGERSVCSDVNISVLQPDGTVVDMTHCYDTYGAPGTCDPPYDDGGLPRDWANGDILVYPHDGVQTPCKGSVGGVAYGNITQDHGTHVGTINTGDAHAATVVQYQEMLNSNIRHALHLWVGCVKPAPDGSGLGHYPATYALPCDSSHGYAAGGGIPGGSQIWLDMDRPTINQYSHDNPHVIPDFLKPWAYAMHEHGGYVLDTGDGGRYYLGVATLESAEPYLYHPSHPAESYWAPWFYQNNGALSGDAELKIGVATPEELALGHYTFLDWYALRGHLWVLDPCYATGTCDDSVPDPGPGTGGPKTYYVGATAPAANDCAGATVSTTPVNTITKGIGCLNSAGGDTLIVQNGTYAEALPDTIPSGTAGAITVIQAANRLGATLRPQSLPTSGAIVALGGTRSAGAAYIRVDGFVIDGGAVPVSGPLVGIAVSSSGTGAAGSGSHDITLQHLEVKNVPNANSCTASLAAVGVAVGSREVRVNLTDVSVHDIGASATVDPGTCVSPNVWTYGIGVSHAGQSSTVDHLQIFRTQGAALSLPGLTASGSNVVRQSYLHDTGAGVQVCGGHANQLYDLILASPGKFGVAPKPDALVLGGACGTQTSGDNIIAGNTIWNGLGTCIQVSLAGTSQPSNNNTIKNTICWQNTTDGVSVNNGSSGTVMDHNMCTGAGCSVSGDPKFVTVPPVVDTDFMTKSDQPGASAAINAGTPVPALATQVDYGGTTRPVGTAWDIGAWETTLGAVVGPGGQVALWHFDEGSGQVAADTLGGKDLTFTGSTLTWPSGQRGPSALGCDAVGAAQNTTVFSLPSYTWSLWWYPTVAPGSAANGVFFNGSSNASWGFAWGHPDPAFRPAVWQHTASETWVSAQFGSAIPLNAWSYIAGTYDATGGVLRSYLNGQRQAQVNAPGPAVGGGPFSVCRGDPGSGVAGRVDEMKVWNRALSDQEVMQDYSGQGTQPGTRIKHHVVAQ